MRRVTLVLVVAAVVMVRTQSPPRAPGEWIDYGGDLSGAKYSAVADSSRENVSRLQIAWEWHSPDASVPVGSGGSASNPGSFNEAKRLVPNKPVRYLLTTHQHFDHTGGMRTYVAEGATIVTHQSNVSYFEKVLTAPSNLAPDSLSKNPRPPTFQAVSDKYVLSDGKQTIEVYATTGDTHTKEYALIYLPKSRILVEGDAYSPGPTDAPSPAYLRPMRSYCTARYSV